MVSSADSMAPVTVAANSDTHTATPTNHGDNVKPTASPRTPIDYKSFQSPFAQRLRPSAIRSLYPLASKPGMLSLFAGLPNPSQFPIKAMKFTLTDDTEIEFTQKELEWSLQYSATGGQPDLNALWKQMLIDEHQPAYSHDQLQVVVGHGSQDLCCKAIECYVAEGEIVLIDDFSYPGAVQYLQTIGADLVGIENDEQGMRIDVLRETCERLKQHNKRIKCMYIVPTGGNPTGYTIPTARRRQIYEIACQYNFLIIEDEPYYYLTFGSAPAPGTLEEFRRPQPEQSFFSMDREGRVLRLDSLSKTFSAGLRVGFIAGPAPLIAPIFQLHSGTTLFSNGPSQVITLKALQHLGPDGFNKHIDAVSYFYCKRRDTFWAAFQKHLGSTGLATAVSPVAGMFLWIKIEGIDDSYDLILKDAVEKLVLLVPGRGFSCDPTCKTPFVRAAFSIADESCFDEAMRRLAELIQEHKQKLLNQEERKQ